MSTLLKLAERCEKSKRRNVNLDCAINIAIHGISWAVRYTTSIDVAMTLMPEGSLWSVCDMEEGPYAQVLPPMPGGGFVGGHTYANARTPALALCAAALRARAMLRAKELMAIAEIDGI